MCWTTNKKNTYCSQYFANKENELNQNIFSLTSILFMALILVVSKGFEHATYQQSQWSQKYQV